MDLHTNFAILTSLMQICFFRSTTVLRFGWVLLLPTSVCLSTCLSVHVCLCMCQLRAFPFNYSLVVQARATKLCLRGHSPPVYILYGAVYWCRQSRLFRRATSLLFVNSHPTRKSWCRVRSKHELSLFCILLNFVCLEVIILQLSRFAVYHDMDITSHSACCLLYNTIWLFSMA